MLKVDFPTELLDLIPEDKHDATLEVLSHDPRPSYQADSDRIYGLSFAGFDIRFTVEQETLYVKEVKKL